MDKLMLLALLQLIKRILWLLFKIVAEKEHKWTVGEANEIIDDIHSVDKRIADTMLDISQSSKN